MRKCARHPRVLTYNGPYLGRQNRKAALHFDLDGIRQEVMHILSRDEYPFACTVEGGRASWVGHIPPGQNSAQGGHRVLLSGDKSPVPWSAPLSWGFVGRLSRNFCPRNFPTLCDARSAVSYLERCPLRNHPRNGLNILFELCGRLRTSRLACSSSLQPSEQLHGICRKPWPTELASK
jgi:hypothetical protein